MGKNTLDLVLKVAGIVLDVLVFIKDKINGRKKDDDKGIAEKE